VNTLLMARASDGEAVCRCGMRAAVDSTVERGAMDLYKETNSAIETSTSSLSATSDRSGLCEPSGSSEVGVPVVCVIVPTRNEAGNVEPLVHRLAESVAGLEVSVLFVDDSTDDTPLVVRSVSAGAVIPVRLLHREAQQRTGGLGGAVVAGLAETAAEWVVVMDGDLQHPPEVISAMLAVAGSEECDVVIASRYRAAGSAGGLSSLLRELVSSGSTKLARALFPRRLSGVSDPLSGFFAMRVAAVNVADLRPNGFKILLEILARSSNLRVAEQPYNFAARHRGSSKASWREGLRFAQQLISLRLSTTGSVGRLLRFAAVGVSGLVLNLLVLRLLLDLPIPWPASERDSVAEVIATQLAICWNFVLTERWAFHHRTHRGSMRRRFAAFWASSTAALVAQLPLAAGLTALSSMSYVLATAVVLVALMLARFVAYDRLLYSGRKFRQNPAVAQPQLAKSAELGVETR
jgi:dolichol-phosphate mannosyltransferase